MSIEPSYLVERLSALRGPLTFTLHPGPDPADPFAGQLRETCELLAAAAPGRLRLLSGPPEERPSLTVANVRYLAIPAGPELEPFLDLLLALDARPGAPASTARQLLLLIAPTCPRCPAVVRVCHELVAGRPAMQLTVVDALRFPDLAGGCRSVPALIIDERVALVGALTSQELERALSQRGLPGTTAADLGSLVQAGRLGDAARLLGELEGSAAFAALFAQGALPDRVGLLLLAEEVLARDPCALDGVLPHLGRIHASPDPSRRGDLADLLGRIGSPAACQQLQALLQDEHPEVREAARAALDARAGTN